MPADRPSARKPSARRPAAARPRTAPPSREGALTGPSGGAGRRGSAARPADVQARRRWAWWGRVPAKELAQFSGRLETLVNAGLPVLRSLRILEGQQKPGPLQDVIEIVADDVEGGAPLSEALSKHPHVFDRLYVNMVRAGEAGGILGTILARLAAFARKTEAIKGQIKGALTYPVLVIFFAGGVLMVAMFVVVPQFEQMFQSFDVEMPALTQALLSISRGLSDSWWVLLAAPALLWATLVLLLRSEAMAYRFDGLKLRLPFFGDVVKKTLVARITRTLGTLLSSGVPILEALDIVRASLANRVVEQAVADVRDAIRNGETMASPLAQSGVFDDMVVNMIDVGEETGQLDTMLVRIAEDSEAELDTSITVLFKALEPVMLLLVALVVGTIAFALFSPMIRLMESMAGASL